jgi:hypothetical protein
MRKVTHVLAMIPSETRTTTAGFNGGAIAVYIVTRYIILIVKEVGKLRDPKQNYFQRRVIYCAWNVISVFDIGAVDKLQMYCSFVMTPDLCCFDRVNLDLN